MSDTDNYDLEIENQGTPPSFFTMIPNMAIDKLDIYALKLLGVYARIIGSNKQCFASNKTVADKVGCSVNRMKQARTVLHKSGYIRYKKGKSSKTGGDTAKVIILWSDIWAMNQNYYNSLVGVSSNDTPPVSSNDTPLSSNDTNKYSLNGDTAETPKNKKDSMPVRAYIDLSHEQCLSNLKGILVNEGKVAGKGNVSAYAIADKIAKALLKRDITPLQVLYMYRHFALINSGLTPPQKADTIQEHVDIMLNSYDTGAQYRRALTGIETGAIIDPATFHHYYRQKTQEQEIEAIPDDIEDDPDFDIFGMLADMRQEQLAQEAQIVDEIEQRRLERQKWLDKKLQEAKNETAT